MALVGIFYQKIDEKSRLLIPKQFLQELGEPLFLVVNPKEYLNLMPQSKWDDLLERYSSLPRKQKRNNRFIFTYSTKVDPDEKGRILIPRDLRFLAKLDGACSVAIVGANDNVEIWNADVFNSFQEACLRFPEKVGQSHAEYDYHTAEKSRD